ncbi:hypothetical protein BGZ58_011177 [Dissophora ornata]|nr:hypothetical protein BGZ58_011177 [Dissophora ornata]
MTNIPTDSFPDSWGGLGDIPLPTKKTLIGSGGFAEVYRWDKDGIQMAVKRIHIADMYTEDIVREVNIVSQLTYKHIIQCYGVAITDYTVSIVTDYAEGGNLKKAIPRLGWEDKERIVAEVALGLGYLHDRGIIHRDIKGDNILLTEHDEVKLCDFGLAKVIAATNRVASPSVLKGTRGYWAPELLGANPAFSTMSDVYALGIVMQELAHGDVTPPGYMAIMNRCLNDDPEKRPTVEEIVSAFHGVHLADDMDNEGSQVKTEQGPSADEEYDLGLGLYFGSGDGVDINRAEGIGRILRSASMGHTKAQVFMGNIYRLGAGVLRDYTKSVKWFQMAADKGYAPAQVALGILHLYGGMGVPQDFGRALDKLQGAANQGHIEACTILGRAYFNGICVAENNEEAMRWFREAAERGNGEAQSYIGIMYYHGRGVEQDYAESKKLMSLAAAQGESIAYVYLGEMYQLGRGVPRDTTEAVKWWLKAAEEGVVMAQFNVGINYMFGWGVSKNTPRGHEWLKKAAEQGHEGHGGQAEVFKAKYRLDDVVVKMFLNSDHEDWRRELELAKQIRDRHIVQFHHTGQDTLMMECLEGGGLSNAISRGSIEDWEAKTRIAKQVSLGLTYLHSHNILHCDIKGADILLAKHLDDNICDFGRARMVGQSGGDGTSPWMAPDLFIEPPQYSYKSNVYALAACIQACWH